MNAASPTLSRPLPLPTLPLPHPAADWRFGPVPPSSRDEVQAFIRAAFSLAYGARIEHFLPALYLLERGPEWAAACGLRPAAGQPLFLERYLDAPVEELLAPTYDAPVIRAGIVEVGHLSLARPGVSRHFIALLTRYLHDRDFQWAVFTAVPLLHNAFRRLGIPLRSLAPALPLRLSPEERAAWGTYYDHHPVVCAVNVGAARLALERRT